MSVQPSELDTTTTFAEPAPPTVLISEHEVMLATAAVTSAIVPAHTAPAKDRRRPRFYPARYTFLENAAMSREMDRL